MSGYRLGLAVIAKDPLSHFVSRKRGECKLLEILFLINFGLKVAKLFALLSG